ncbi:hypothetical protein M9H77_06580 [Catharanthus roseus]|uniref:Uncharacterized protein n=1 Tax=Catharanthus roseus TaxID=4058 RepID=A0ACC0BSM0_CATRO|nr:hypothetical protein M9H77_06580 [Catharanthus roseus]
MTRGQKSMKKSSSGASPSDSLTHRDTPPSTASPTSNLQPPPPADSVLRASTTRTVADVAYTGYSMSQPSITAKVLVDPQRHVPNVRDTTGKKYFCWNPDHHVKARECFMKLVRKRGSLMPSLMIIFIESSTLIEMKQLCILKARKMQEHRENGAHMPTDVEMMYEQMEDIARRVIADGWIGRSDQRSSAGLLTPTTYSME